MTSNNIKRLYAASTVAVATLGLLPTQSAWAISGNIKFETTKTTYNKGDLAEVEITIKTDDGASFLLQTNMELSAGLSLQAVTGDNIQYNRGKIVGTAPQSEFVITITMKVNDASDQTIILSDTKMGSVDGSPNYTINKTEKTIDIKEEPVETEPAPTEPTPTTPPTEPAQPTEPSAPEETQPAYKAWKATVQVSDELNIRQGPGLNYGVIGKYQNGEKLMVTDEKKVGDITWLKVERGWISKDYVVKGHIETPEKTDEEIEQEQQEQIKDEANNAEDQNQANNEAAQKQDEAKKEEYDKQEKEQSQTVESIQEDITSDETIEPTEETIESIAEGTLVTDLDIGVNPVTPIEGLSYVLYQTKEMQQPFYLYQESYSLKFPEELQKTSVKIGGLDFLVAIPNDVSMIRANVYVVYGNYDTKVDPSLYYFDADSNSFFPYEKIAEKTVIIDKTVEYEKKSFSKSHLLIGAFSILGLYALGAFTTAMKYRKKEKEAAEAAIPHNITVTKPKPMATQPAKSHAEVYDMSDDEFEELLKVYGASSSDIMAKQNPKPAPKATPVPTHAKTPEMKWDTLARLMTNPEDIEETPPVAKEADKKLQKDIKAIEEKKAAQKQQIEQAVSEISLNINQENSEDIAKDVEEKIAQTSLLLDSTEPLEMTDLPEMADIEVGEINPAAIPDMNEIPDMYLKFEQAVEEDGLKDRTSPKEAE